MVVEIRRRLVHDAKSVCVKRRHGAMPTWAMPAGEVLQEELAAAACFFCCLLLLLLQVLLLLHEGTHTRCRAPASVSPASQRQLCLKRERSKRSGLRPSRGKLGQSKASGKFSANRKQLSNLISTTFGSTVICFPNMTNLAISSQICLGFVTSRRYRENR